MIMATATSRQTRIILFLLSLVLGGVSVLLLDGVDEDIGPDDADESVTPPGLTAFSSSPCSTSFGGGGTGGMVFVTTTLFPVFSSVVSSRIVRLPSK